MRLPFDDGSFDVTVCYGGPISYAVDRTEDAIAELARVTRPGGHVLVSVMSLVGALQAYADSTDPERPELRALLGRLELELAAEPGALDCGPHILAVVHRRTA